MDWLVDNGLMINKMDRMIIKWIGWMIKWINLLIALSRWWEVVGNSEIVKTGINRLSNSEWWKAKTSKKMTLQLEVRHNLIVLFLNNIV